MAKFGSMIVDLGMAIVLEWCLSSDRGLRLYLEGVCSPSGELELLLGCEVPPSLWERSSWLPELWLSLLPGSSLGDSSVLR